MCHFFKALAVQQVRDEQGERFPECRDQQYRYAYQEERDQVFQDLINGKLGHLAGNKQLRTAV